MFEVTADDADKEIQCTFSKSADDNKVGGSVNIYEVGRPYRGV